MPFCCACGWKMNDQDRFCTKCGTPAYTGTPAPSAPVANAPIVSAPVIQQPAAFTAPNQAYVGTEQCFSLLGKELYVSAGMDTFNYYRKLFKKLAKHQADALAAEYRATIHDLDSFLVNFPEMYARYRKPLLDYAMSLILQSGVYDLSAKQFEDQHTADFCLCAEDVDTAIESFNLTIEANQDRKIRMYNMMPGVVFSGIGGFAAALAMNIAVTSIAEADIRNANVSKKQRAEIFGRIDTDVLMERAFIDYWRVFLSMTWQLNRKGCDVWYPNDADNESASGLLGNLNSGMIPPDKVPDILVKLLQLNPYSDDPLLYIKNHVMLSEKVLLIFDYFGLEV